MEAGEMTRTRLRFVLQLVSVIVLAAALKFAYSRSSVNELVWVLGPTTSLVEIVTGEEFKFESYAGYMSRDQSFLIADSCSGVNFMIVAFLVLAAIKMRKGWNDTAGWSFLPIAAFVAYGTTLVANTVRIAVAMRQHRMYPDMIWVNPEQMHRFEGIFIYFGFLVLLYLVAENLYDRGYQKVGGSLSLFKRTLIPLGIYWFVVLGVPLVNGAYRQGKSFWEHTLFVLFTPLLLVLPLIVVGWIIEKRRAMHSPSTLDPVRHF